MIITAKQLTAEQNSESKPGTSFVQLCTTEQRVKARCQLCTALYNRTASQSQVPALYNVLCLPSFSLFSHSYWFHFTIQASNEKQWM